MTPLEPDPPPVGEEIHLPGQSVLPLITAVGITLTIIGITTVIELTIIGAIITIACIYRWIVSTRREIDELPLDAHHE
jgi:hypothetical protein